jgi:hypothetical protein
MAKHRRNHSRDTPSKRQNFTTSSDTSSNSMTESGIESGSGQASSRSQSSTITKSAKTSESKSASEPEDEDKSEDIPSHLRHVSQCAPHAPTPDPLHNLPATAPCSNLGETGLATPPTTPQFSRSSTIVNFFENNAGLALSTHTFTHATPTETFPVFNSGTVVIRCNLVAPPKHWHLHVDVLARHSSWFRHAMLLSPQKGKHLHDWIFFLLEEHDGELALVLQEAIPKNQRECNESQAVTIKHEEGLDTTPGAVSTPPSSSPADPSSSPPCRHSSSLQPNLRFFLLSPHLHSDQSLP